MKFSVRPVLYVVALMLAGCSSFSLDDMGLGSKKIDYKTAGNAKVPTLEIPPDLTSPTRDDRFAVPDTGGKGVATHSDYSRERSDVAQQGQAGELLLSVDKAHIERAGNQRWLVINESPDKLWGTIKDFWQENGFIIKQDMPSVGIMETDWAENRAKIGQDFLRNLLGKLIEPLYSTAERDRFRTRIEPGATPGTTDVFITHRGMYETYTTEGKDETRWQPRDADPELEIEMLRRLMVYFGSDQKRSETQAQIARTKPPEKAKLALGSGGASTLQIQEPFDRAWRRVGLSLDRIGFTVEDRDRSKGLYFVRYVDPEVAENNKSDGWLSKLAFWKGSEPKPQTQYRVLVKGDGSITSVQVLSTEGGVDQSETAKKILGLLYEQLK